MGKGGVEKWFHHFFNTPPLLFETWFRFYRRSSFFTLNVLGGTDDPHRDSCKFQARFCSGEWLVSDQ